MRKTGASGICLLWFALATAGWAQIAVFDISQFESGPDYALQRDAAIAGGRLWVAAPVAERGGGAWYSRKTYVAGGFETSFRFVVSNSNGRTNEGFAFVVQNNVVPGLGPAGNSLGFAGVPNSLAIEFDPVASAAISDGSERHISVQTLGTLPNSADHAASLGSTAAGLLNFADGAIHTARINYTPGSLAVILDETSVLTVPLDLSTRLSLDRGQAWIGFTASDSMEILEWSFVIAANPIALEINAPLNGSSFLAPARVYLEATVQAPGAQIMRVEYFHGATKLGESTAHPFGVYWDTVLPGMYSVTATAYDDQGRTNVSQPVQIAVLSDTPPIGINFCTGIGGTNFLLDPATLAGVLPQRNWNNFPVFTNGNASSSNIKDSLGKSTSIDVTVDFAGRSDDPALNVDLSGDHQLMRAFAFDLARTPGFQTNSTIAISQIPFSVYDVIVHSDDANQGADRVTRFRIGTNSIYLRDAKWASFSGLYARAAGTADLGVNTSAGNYVRFYGLTAANITVNVTTSFSTDSFPRGVVNAIQIVPSVFDSSFPPILTRGPYLQNPTSRSIILRWRTNRPVQSWVRYGTVLGAPEFQVDDPTVTSEHSISLTNLLPSTRYYYSIGTTNVTFAGGSSFFFWTYPETNKSTRVWVLGDSGTADASAAAVRDAYYAFSAGRHTDVWLMLGDNAYQSGTDGQFQSAVFNMYPTMLRQAALWSCVGNHDTAQSHTFNETIPYYRIHDFPKNGEAGGVASGTEQYYSFNHGIVHFIVLDAMTSDRSSNGTMCTWLRADLDANTNHWLIALWHHPPYTKGSHDSDNQSGGDVELVEMRENVLPIIESYGVDLVLSGHSHCYERSFLVYGHYGYAESFSSDYLINGGSGRTNGSGAYVKSGSGEIPYAGTVYVVAGSSGQATFLQPDAPHPVMFTTHLNLGSLVLDIDNDTLQARFLRETGQVLDYFSIVKQAPAESLSIVSTEIRNTMVCLTWQAINGRTYVVQHAAELLSPVWNAVSESIVATNSSMTWVAPVPPGSSRGFYRLVALGD